MPACARGTPDGPLSLERLQPGTALWEERGEESGSGPQSTKRTGYEEPWGVVRDSTPLITESSSGQGRSERDSAVNSRPSGTWVLSLRAPQPPGLAHPATGLADPFSAEPVTIQDPPRKCPLTPSHI